MNKRFLTAIIITGVMAISCACGGSTNETTAAPTTVAETTAVVETTVAESSEAQTTAGADAQTSVSDGIVVDASMNFFMIQDQSGKVLMFTMPEDGNYENNLADGLMLGRTVKVTYTGDSDNGNAVVSALDDSDVKAELDADVYQTVSAIDQTIKLQDMDGLADYMEFPCYVHTASYDDVVEDRDAFNELDKAEVFNADFSMLVDYNMFDLKETDAGVVVGDATPNYILSKSDNGSYMITGINAVK